jgi:hypothetical protein
LEAGHVTRFFSIDVDGFVDPAIVDSVSWAGDPAEPGHCAAVDAATVKALSDWGFEGRHALQNEYCEYAVVQGTDASGKLRPKRVQITTELREYWTCIAVHDPDRVRDLAATTLERDVQFSELYGADPATLNPQQRETEFSRLVAGNGGNPGRGPDQPIGAINRENALFMTHPINGLDDLIFIVLFGARRYAVRQGKEFRRATLDEIFRDGGAPELACRHADPRAADGAYDAVLQDKLIGFANPLGMYLRDFNTALLTVEGQPIPPAWVRWGRGQKGMCQRLEIGPGDDDEAFLDDITFSDDRGEEPLTGGHQIVAALEVGPLLAAVDTAAAAEHEFTLVPEAPTIACANTGICATVEELKKRFDAAQAEKPGPRRPPRG